jgi:putative hydrolase of the HAD superfamily
VKPSPTIFLAALELVGAEPGEAVMVGDSPADDVDGARALGIRAFLIDREGRFPAAVGRLDSLRDLPPALGLDRC